MIAYVKNQRYIQADETALKVLDKDKKVETRLGYLWVYHALLSKLCLFDYQKGRRIDAPRQMFTDYRGSLQADGYEDYDHYCFSKEIKHLTCWAHAPWYFEKALLQDHIHASYPL